MPLVLDHDRVIDLYSSCARANDRSVVTSDVQVANVLVETETNFRAAVCC